MDKIIEDYYLESNSVLAYYEEGTNGVNCWFDAGNFRQHRCLSFEDFALIKGIEA